MPILATDSDINEHASKFLTFSRAVLLGKDERIQLVNFQTRKFSVILLIFWLSLFSLPSSFLSVPSLILSCLLEFLSSEFIIFRF